MEIMTASTQWANRPNDERYTSLLDMRDAMTAQRNQSRAVVASSRQVQAVPGADHKGLTIEGPSGAAYAPTNWAFGQLATLVKAPASYLRTLPAELAADCLNIGFKVNRAPEDMGLLLYKNGESVLRAATGPKYGRIWNADVVATLISHFGDGVNGQWRVPGEFGVQVPVTKETTTLYASDRDMWVFLADEERRIEVPNRRNGKSGSMARGFFVWNSEVGSEVFGLSTFLFDYMCMNHIIWGATDVKEVRIRHTASAPDKFLDQITPALQTYAESSDRDVTAAIEAARSVKLADQMEDFLAKRFTKNLLASMETVHALEEGRPMETAWDAVVASTAVARSMNHMDTRVDVERKAGELMTAAAKLA